MRTIILSGKSLEPFLPAVKETFEPQGYTIAYLPMADLTRQLSMVRPDLLLADGQQLQQEAAEHPLQWWLEQRSKPGLEKTELLFMGNPILEDAGGSGSNLGNTPVDTLQEWLNAGLEDCFGRVSSAGELVAKLQLYLKHKQQFWHMEAMVEQINQMNEELYERNTAVEKELYTTRQLQQSLLPTPLPEEEAPQDANTGSNLLGNQGLGQVTETFFHLQKTHYKSATLRISGLYLPCDALGGDLYDVVEFHDKSIGVTVADVSGHGVPAGFVTALFKSSFYRSTLNEMSPDKVLFQLNNELCAMVTTGAYVTGLYLRLTPDGRHMEYAGAGHPYPIYYQAASKSIIRLQENGTPLVWIPDMDYNKKEQSLAPGDKILLFTDGASEIHNQALEILDEPRLEKMFLETVQENPRFILDTMIAKLSDYTEGHPLQDDLSLALIEVL